METGHTTSQRIVGGRGFGPRVCAVVAILTLLWLAAPGISPARAAAPAPAPSSRTGGGNATAVPPVPSPTVAPAATHTAVMAPANAPTATPTRQPTPTAVPTRGAAPTVAASATVAAAPRGAAPTVDPKASTAPTIAKITPGTGDTGGGTQVTITGTNFVAGATVSFDDAAATNVTVQSATTLTATTPAHASGPVRVTVSDPNGSSGALDNGFAYTSSVVSLLALPSITSLSPATGNTSGGTKTTITGSSFTGATSVTFGGTAATSFTVVSSTQITAYVPAKAAGSVTVAVTTSGGTGSKSLGFTYNSTTPNITSISPTSGPAAGGQSVTISGTNLSSASVLFGSTAGTVTANTASSITVTTPAGSVGAVDVQVSAASSNDVSRSGYTYNAAPTVTTLNPTSGPTAGGTSVTITGTNFSGATAVSFGGVAATSFTVNSGTQITATTPAGTVGAVTVGVTTAGGTGSKSSAFTYVAPPNATSASPANGPTAGGTVVTITGTDFVNGATVTFGGTAATAVTFVSSTSLTATTAAHTAGVVDIVVTNPDGQSDTLTGGFTYNGTLSITAAPANFSYPSTALTGDVLTLTSSFAVGVNDATFSNAGWNLQASIGTLTNAGSDTIPASGHTITAATVSGTTGTAPTNSVGYPIQIPTTTGKIYNAAANTGNGQATVTFDTNLSVPANTPVGTYSATLTITIVSGP